MGCLRLFSWPNNITYLQEIFPFIGTIVYLVTMSSSNYVDQACPTFYSLRAKVFGQMSSRAVIAMRTNHFA